MEGMYLAMSRPTYLKAVIAAIGAFLAQLQLIFVSDDLTFDDISPAQWVLLVSVSFNAGVATFAFRNGQSSDPDTSTPGPDPRDGGMEGPPSSDGEWIRLPTGEWAQVVRDDPHHPMQ